MIWYVFRRCLYALPTLFIILTLQFFIVQLVPKSPVKQATRYFSHAQWQSHNAIGSIKPPAPLNSELTPLPLQFAHQFGFDKPLAERYLQTVKHYLSFQLGHSFFKRDFVSHLILKGALVSLFLAFCSTLLVYSMAILISVLKAHSLSHYDDKSTQFVVVFSYAFPPLLLALVLILFFAAGTCFSFFPLNGLISENIATLSFWGKIKDYVWHLFLPLLTLVFSNLGGLILLTRRTFWQEMTKPYFLVAKAKGLTQRQILYRHIFRNAAIVIFSKFPSLFAGLLFNNIILIEIIFSLPGLGSLGYEAIVQRDYPVILGTVYIFNLIGLGITLTGDIILSFIDPCIRFKAL